MTSKLVSELTYLYGSADQRYWYDTRPTLKKTVTDRAKQQKADDILLEIEKTLRAACKNKELFDSVHIAPPNSGDVPDQPSIRLVLFAPSLIHKRDRDDSPAMDKAREYLEYRGSTPCIHRNMILFLAPDEGVVSQLKKDMGMLMAWRSIDHDADTLNLDNEQKKETKEAIKQFEKIVADRVREAYQHLLVPAQYGTSPVIWEKLVVQGGGGVKIMRQRQRKNSVRT